MIIVFRFYCNLILFFFSLLPLHCTDAKTSLIEAFGNEDEENEDKIIQNLTKEVVIDKVKDTD